MEEQHTLALLNNWKVVAGIAGVIAVILLLSFLLTLMQNSRATQPYTQPTPAQKSSLLFPTSSVQETSVPRAVQFYRDHHLSLRYPSDWEATVHSVEGGGEVMNLVPPEDRGTSGSLSIQVIPQGVADIASMTKLFQTFGFIAQKKILDGVSVTVYGGNIQTLTTTVHEKALLGVQAGEVYLVKYLAPSERLRGELDEVFSTFHFLSN